MPAIAHELRHALRSLVRSRRISLVSVTLFAVTIGVTTAIDALVDAVMLRPIDMLAPDRTVVIWQRDDARDTSRSSARQQQPSVLEELDVSSRRKEQPEAAPPTLFETEQPGPSHLSTGTWHS